MKPKDCMVIAGEASGDCLAAELVEALRSRMAAQEDAYTPEMQPLRASLAPRFYGAGGPRMAAAGVRLDMDLTAHAITGIIEVFKHLFKFRRIFRQLYSIALTRQPDLIICVDYSGFNLRFARAIRKYARGGRGTFHNWEPKIVQYVSPQVWASRAKRAQLLERNVDLLVCTFPFEKEWYTRRTPGLRVEYVGNPLLDRHAAHQRIGSSGPVLRNPDSPLILLLPGSRSGEIQRHAGVVAQAAAQISKKIPCRVRMILPDENLANAARALVPGDAGIELSVGGLAEALAQADLAIASTGTVTLECAYFGVPTVALYKTSWATYQIARRMAKVQYVAMPNLLAERLVFPEFIQEAATPDNLAQAGLMLLEDLERRKAIKRELADLVKGLGSPGAVARAADAIASLVRDGAHPFPLRAHLRS